MTIDPEIIKLINQLLSLNWSVAMGLVFAPLFFLLGVWFLGWGQWPREYKLREVTVGTIFLVLGALSASGASNIVSGLWIFLAIGFAGWAFFETRKWAFEWLAKLPFPGQVYRLPGIGEVVIINVDGASPYDGHLLYEDASEARHKVLLSQFHEQATLLKDRTVQPPS